MIRFVLFFSLLCSINLWSQNEGYSKTLDTLKYHFNNGDVQSIYDMWDESMQSALPLEVAKTVLGDIRAELGNISKFTYVESSGTIDTYLTDFQNGQRNLLLNMDQQGKINGLIFEEVPLSQGNPRYTMAMQSLVTYFNDGNTEGLHGMFSEAMKAQLSLETTAQVIETFKGGLGNILSTEYLETKGITEIHLATFEKGKQNILIAVNADDKLTGLRFVAPDDSEVQPKMERNITKLRLPFKGSWFTVWGGDTKAQNYHVISTAQRRAFDFLVLGKNNKTYERSGTRNEDYFAFGKPLYAVCDAEVIEVITGVEDNKPGEMNPAQALGNSVTLLTKNQEYIVYAHFRKGTIKVKEGDMVKKGQYLGECGNSGNSSEAHLHLHIQDGPEMISSVGVKCYFEEVMVKGELKTDYSPVRLDGISLPEE